MPNKEPIRRNDVIRCENCGEDYAITYKRCPFCDDFSSRLGSAGGVTGRRVANNRRGGGYGGPVNPIQIIMVVISLILIIAAVFIVFNAVSSLFHRDPGGTSGISSSQTDPGTSSEDPGTSSQDPSGSTQNPDSSDEPSIQVNRITLDQTDFTLYANEINTITAQVTPASALDSIVWSSNNDSVAVVRDEGNGKATVVNVNTNSDPIKVTITATCGDKSAECFVYCRGGSSGDVTAESIGTVTGANSGLKIRSGPGTDYPVQDSASNGAKLTILGDAGDGWYKIRYTVTGGKTQMGYVSKDYVTID